MMALPCTLPALFVVVPLSLREGARKGLAIAALFGAGLTTTLAAYGIAVAWLGKILYLDRATLVMWLVAGVMAYAFGLEELGLLKIRWPSFGIRTMSKGGEYVRSYSLGVLLGNAGIGCPNPLFYLLLAYIASTASIGLGGILGALHGVGRAIPLLALSALAVVGVNAVGPIARKQATVKTWVGWGLTIFGTLVLPKPLFGHAWWELSAIHELWNLAVAGTLGTLVAESAAIETLLGDVAVHDPWMIYGPWLFLGTLWSLPVTWKDFLDGKAKWKMAVKLIAIWAFSIAMAYTGEAIPHTHVKH